MHIVSLYDRVAPLPFGRWLFSRLVCLQAPYFSSIRPVFTELKPGLVAAEIKNRRKVHNHIKTVHAIACCNLCELVAGVSMMTSLPAGKRWIPKGMTVQYVNKAKTDLSAFAAPGLIASDYQGDLPVKVDVKDTNGTVVVTAEITMYISDSPGAIKAR